MPTESTIALSPDGEGNANVMIDGDVAFTISLSHEGWRFLMPGMDRPDVTMERVPLASRASSTSGVEIDEANGRVCFREEGRPDVVIPVASDIPGPESPSPGAFPLVGQDKYMREVAYGLLHRHNMIVYGPTGCGKTASIEYIAKALNWNLVIVSVTPGANEDTMVGTQMPAAHEETGAPTVEWVDRMVARAVRLSQKHPTILLIDEINRIRDVNEYAALMPLLDGTARLTLPTGEVLDRGDLVLVATANPPDEYIGTNELDPAFENRLPWAPRIDYPAPADEAEALVQRVPTLATAASNAISLIAERIRTASEIHHPVGFRSLLMMAQAVTSGLFTWAEAADRALIAKFPRDEQQAVSNIVSLFAVDDNGNPLSDDASVTGTLTNDENDSSFMWGDVVAWNEHGYGMDASGNHVFHADSTGRDRYVVRPDVEVGDHSGTVVVDVNGEVHKMDGVAQGNH